MKCSICRKKLKWNEKQCPYCHTYREPLRISHLFHKVVKSVPSILIGLAIWGGIILLVVYEEKEQKEDQEENIAQAISDLDIHDKKEAEKLITEWREAVFSIHTDYGSGTGFLYNDDGMVLTSTHVVDESKPVTVRSIRDQNNTAHEGEVIGYSPDYHLALIEVEGLKGMKPYPLQLDDELDIDEQVIAVSALWTNSSDLVSVGNIFRHESDLTLNGENVDTIYNADIYFTEGFRGAPLISVDNREIVSMNLSADRIGVFSYSIPLFLIKDQIEEWLES